MLQTETRIESAQVAKLREAIEALKAIDYRRVQQNMGELQDGTFAVDVTVCGSGCIKFETLPINEVAH